MIKQNGMWQPKCNALQVPYHLCFLIQIESLKIKVRNTVSYTKKEKNTMKYRGIRNKIGDAMQ